MVKSLRSKEFSLFSLNVVAGKCRGRWDTF